jgi:hypothetical protein
VSKRKEVGFQNGSTTESTENTKLEEEIMTLDFSNEKLKAGGTI